MSSVASLHRDKKQYEKRFRDDASNSDLGHKARVIENYFGKKVDKITKLQNTPGNPEIESIYHQDYHAYALANAKKHAESTKSIPFDSVSQQSLSVQGQTGNLSLKDHTSHQSAGNRVTFNVQEDQEKRPSTMAASRNFSHGSLRKFKKDNWEPRFDIEKKQSSLSSLNFNGIKNSLYTRDYTEHDLKDTVPVKKPDLWSTFHSKFPMEGLTVNKQDYVNWKMPPPERMKDPARLLTLDIPLNAGTSYRNQFVDWGPNAARLLMPAKPGTVIKELPFDERTVYKDTFGGKKREMAPSIDVSLLPAAKKESVMSSTIPFLGQTCYKASFQGFKVAKVGGAQKAHVEDAIPTRAAYKGNFVSTKARDFADPRTKVYYDEDDS